ncbi:MAG TPA: hypothetical protein PKE45_19920, partial [Caldilineaceae bacterium]|nr:hypothetical protein [Caldilineaceae bacterium]
AQGVDPMTGKNMHSPPGATMRAQAVIGLAIRGHSINMTGEWAKKLRLKWGKSSCVRILVTQAYPV